jgi:hypothetical protein
MTDETRRSPAETVSQARFTEADYNAWRFQKNAVHLNGGSVFFGWGHRCIDQPRLLVIDKYFKKDRSTKRSFVVDDSTSHATLDEALAALSVPPRPTSVQLELLATVPAEWFRPERRAELSPLGAMGLIEWGRDANNKVTCRLTAAGAEQLTAYHRPEGDPNV